MKLDNFESGQPTEALQKGHSSLDYRLMDALHVYENVLKLLRELCLTLIEINLGLVFGINCLILLLVILILSEARLPYDMEPRPGSAGDDEQSDSSSIRDDMSETSMSSNESSPHLSELQQRFTLLIDIIDKLYQLS
jgi:hypothetical protein